jgi:hypothetical protein
MVRDVAVLGAAMMAIQVACPHALGAPVTEANLHHAQHKPIAALRTATAHKISVRRQVTRATEAPEPTEAAVQLPTPEVDTSDGAPTPLAFHVGRAIVAPEPDLDAGGSSRPGHKRHENASAEPAFDIPLLPTTPPSLSDQESEAGQMAAGQGDRTFVMVDKARGKIILFENGQPVFAGPALTGESTADQMPKTELGEKFDTLNAPDTKITPAGRYTVERGFDPEVGGPLFDIHEIRGKDWGIAIHQLYLGIPAEHRDARILSPSEEDKHITFGCINVQTATLHLLMHELRVKGPIPLYILPEDASQTAAYLTPRTSS